jgi:AcrR family transcriptional regulator
MSYVTERRLEEKERRRAEILDAAESVAGAVGIDAMTMDEVARTARLSRALLYVYFADKSDLLFGLCDRALDTLHQRFIAASARHRLGLEQIEACGRAYVAFAQEFPVYFEALARFEAHAPDTSGTAPAVGNEQACMLRGGKVHAVMVDCIERGIVDGSIRRDAGSPILISITLWGFLHGIIQIAATKGQVLAQHAIATQQLVDQALTLCSRALRPTTAPPT